MNEDRERLKDRGLRVRALFQLELVFVILCWVMAVVAVLAWFFHAPFGMVVSLGVLGGCCGLGALIVSRRMKPLYAAADRNIEQARERLRQREARLRQLEDLLTRLQQARGVVAPVQATAPPRLPCAVGFANLGGEAWRELAERDAAALAPLFARSRSVAGHVTVAEVLFVYAALLEDGTLEGTSGAGMRQIVDLTGAKLVILASPNSAERVHTAAALPGLAPETTANLVFTIDRAGEGFARFFKGLFALMRDCGDMPAAWAQLEARLAAVPGDDAPRSLPQMLLIAEGEGEVSA